MVTLFAISSPTLSRSYEILSRSTNVCLLRWIKAFSPERARWAYLARSGSQSEHRIRFILPTGPASYIIIQGTEPRDNMSDPDVTSVECVTGRILEGTGGFGGVTKLKEAGKYFFFATAMS